MLDEFGKIIFVFKISYIQIESLMIFDAVLFKTNKDKLLIQQVTGRIAPPTLSSGGPSATNYVTTWDGRPKLGIGSGGIKYNVDVGDSCFGWPEAEYLSPGVTIEGAGTGVAIGGGRGDQGTTTVCSLCCLGNVVSVQDGEGKGANGIVTGKVGYTGRSGITVHFKKNDLEKLGIGDHVRVRVEGVGLRIEGFDGKLFSMSPIFLENFNPELNGDTLIVPVTREVPAYAMGSGSGGGTGMSGHYCIQSNPPELVEELKLGDLKIGDLVACRDIRMEYGKGYYRGAVTVGVVAFGASEQAGHGPGVFAIITSKNGKIKPRIEANANITKYLKLEV